MTPRGDMYEYSVLEKLAVVRVYNGNSTGFGNKMAIGDSAMETRKGK